MLEWRKILELSVNQISVISMQRGEGEEYFGSGAGWHLRTARLCVQGKGKTHVHMIYLPFLC